MFQIIGIQQEAGYNNKGIGGSQIQAEMGKRAAFSILEEIIHSEHIWHVRNRNYDVAVCERLVAYNCIVMVDQIRNKSTMEIMDLVV